MRSLLRRCGLAVSGLLVMTVLAGCGAPGDGVYRDVSVAMGATSRFDPDRFAGDWQVVARFADAPVGPMRFSPQAGVLRDLGGARSYVVGPGGLAVMWVDDGFRTAALGSVDGQVGVILDRRASAAPDRMRAAREIMEFYGWQTDRLNVPE